MKKKGFTLIELLVVIAIIALLMGILMPALVRVRQLAIRMLCGTQLKGVGNAMMVYAGDNDDEYPIAGAKIAIWGAVSDPLAQLPVVPHTSPTISESFFLLVKDGYTTPKQFVCGGDWADDLRFSDYKSINGGNPIPEWSVAIDFMRPPAMYCSYSYHLPYYIGARPGFPISSLSDPQSPLCADRNPYLDYKATYIDDTPVPVINSSGDYYDPDGVSNSNAHQREGQNVLFNDFHVLFEDHPNVGIDNDNIWVAWPTVTKPVSPQNELPTNQTRPVVPPTTVGPQSTKDAFLVNDTVG